MDKSDIRTHIHEIHPNKPAIFGSVKVKKPVKQSINSESQDLNIKYDSTENPWSVGNLDYFLYYCCPECDERDNSKEDFLKHAIYQHPKSKEYFGFLFLFKHDMNYFDVQKKLDR